MQDCPNCGFSLEEDFEICPSCQFNFNDTISCPFKISLRCIHKSEKCEVSGLDYEICEIYLKKVGI